MPEIEDFVLSRNRDKPLFTPGPGPLLVANISGLRPCFGRNDADYRQVEESVINDIRRVSGQESVVPLQGSASLAIEIASRNFLKGKVAVLVSGFYGQRLSKIIELTSQSMAAIDEVSVVTESDLLSSTETFDWLVSCVTETSNASLIPLATLRTLADRVGAKLFVDATGSIGLEPNHHLAEVAAFSSCKGLFGFTGASFVAYNTSPANEVHSFYLDLRTHIDRLVTGPYHSICSLYKVLPEIDRYRSTVETNKRQFVERYESYLTQPIDRQPLLCTGVTISMETSGDAVMYHPRSTQPGSVVCHLGEAHLKNDAKGEILKYLYQL